MPATAFNSSSLADLAATTEAGAQAQIEGAATSGHTSVLDSLFEGLPDGMPFTLALLTVLARGILGVPDAVWNSVHDLIGDVPVLGSVADGLQELIDAILTGLTGTATTGNSPSSVALALLGQVGALPGNILDLLFGQQSTQQAQINALQSAGFSHDFAADGVTGWNDIVGVLVLSGRGGYVQASTETVAYRTGAASERHGAHMVINPNMRGVCRLGICSDSAASDWVGLEAYSGFDGDALRIVTGGSPTLTVVQKQRDFVGPNRLTSSTGLDIRTDGVDGFSVLRNGTQVLDWTDAGGIAEHDSAHRNVVLTSNGFDRNEDGLYGPLISQVVGYAW